MRAAATHIPAMAKKPRRPETQAPAQQTIDQRLKSHEVIDFARFAQTGSLDVERRKIEEIINVLWLPASLTQEERGACIVRAIDLYESINPTDSIEAMLAMQMVAAHHSAMECARRAMLENQTFEVRNMALNQAHKMMMLGLGQVAAINKHRGKGQQQVTVKHVHVADGGHAIVGNVNAIAGKDVASPVAAAGRAALADCTEPSVPPVSSLLKQAKVQRP